MDMKVSTEAFSSASSSLKKHCNIIETITDIFMKKLAAANSEFDDVNYSRTVTSMTAVKTQIAAFSTKVDTLNKDLTTLEDLVNHYANGGYGR